MEVVLGINPSCASWRQRVELGQAVGTVIDAGVLVHHLKAGEDPELVLHDRPADGADVVLA